MWHGREKRVLVWRGMDWLLFLHANNMARQGGVGPGMVGHSVVWQGVVWLGYFSYMRTPRQVQVGTGMARHGKAGRDKDWLGQVWYGKVFVYFTILLV